jgi:uncharacterized protein
MKQIIILITLISLFWNCGNKTTEKQKIMTDSATLAIKSGNTYDSVLAKKLGADEYGMKKYVMAFFKKGPNRNQDSVTIAEIQKGHMANIKRLADEGKLIIAGPFMDDFDIRGIFIFNVETIEEASALAKTDPAIKSGRLALELHPWYGSAALMEVNAIHKKVTKKGFE